MSYQGAGLEFGWLTRMASQFPRLERLIISVNAEPVNQPMRPFESLKYLELRTSFLNFNAEGFSMYSAARSISALLRSDSEFVFTSDPALSFLAHQHLA